MDNKGYVMSGISLLLILPAILLIAVFLDMTNEGIGENARVISSESVLNTFKDLEAHIMVAGKEVLKSEAESVMNSGIPLSDSRTTIKGDLQFVMDQKVQDYKDNTGMELDCNITSVDNSEDPFAVQINSTIYVEKGNITHLEHISQDIPITDPQYPIPDPLPFIKCKEYGGVQVVDNKICYGSSLADYLDKRGVANAFAYQNSTTAFIINKCPYDPYKMHGNNNTLKNCIDNGYFHESADGPCFLCRLEGKGTCLHYGMETFIVPSSSTNTSVNSSNSSENFTYNTAPSSIDHVIFDDIFNGTYQGDMIIYHTNGFEILFIYLENAHRSKYGFLTI